MNFPAIIKILRNVIKYEILLLFIPLIVSLYYGQGDAIAFIYTILVMLPIYLLLLLVKCKSNKIYAKEGFLTVGLAWIIISFFGALPFVFNGCIPSIIDAFFETSSGFTTTGATILQNVEVLPNGILFWRSFTHWVGGMGFLIFILAFMPSLGGDSIQLLKAESPGPAPGKIVPKIKQTAKILYAIYFALTIIEIILLKIAGLGLYDAVIHALGTAGTGGFSNMNASVAAFNNPAVEWIITIFMLMFGVNFVLYYQLIKGNIKNFFKSEELRWYVIIVLSSIAIITANILSLNNGKISLSIREAAFQVGSIITTTGYATTDFNLWPTLSKMILVMLMLMGAMAGSTGGGIKTIRIVIVFKAIRRELDKIIHPRRIKSVKVDGNVIDEGILSGISIFIFSYMVIALIAIIIVSFDGFDGTSTVTAVIATLSNIGPGLGMVGPTGNFSQFSDLSKIVLSFCMLAGRLELYPMLIMFSPSLWKKKF